MLRRFFQTPFNGLITEHPIDGAYHIAVLPYWTLLVFPSLFFWTVLYGKAWRWIFVFGMESWNCNYQSADSQLVKLLAVMAWPHQAGGSPHSCPAAPRQVARGPQLLLLFQGAFFLVISQAEHFQHVWLKSLKEPTKWQLFPLPAVWQLQEDLNWTGGLKYYF